MLSLVLALLAMSADLSSVHECEMCRRVTHVTETLIDGERVMLLCSPCARGTEWPWVA